MRYICENCGKEFHQEEMTTYESKNICKICKVQIIQSKSKSKFIARGGRKASNLLTPYQEEYVRKNYNERAGRELAKELDVSYNVVSYYIKKNKIKKETI